jgi:hypothetical protein
LRYLWTDAFGVVLLLSLQDKLGEKLFLDPDRTVGWAIGPQLRRRFSATSSATRVKGIVIMLRNLQTGLG